MGDKSPKSKQRTQTQKAAVKKQDAAAAKTKQVSNGRPTEVKGKK